MCQQEFFIKQFLTCHYIYNFFVVKFVVLVMHVSHCFKSHGGNKRFNYDWKKVLKVRQSLVSERIRAG